MVRRGVFRLPATSGARGRRAPSAAKTSSRSPRSSTAARTSTPSGRTRPRSSSGAGRSRPSTTAGRRAAGEAARPARGADGLAAAGTPPAAGCSRHALHAGRRRLDRGETAVVRRSSISRPKTRSRCWSPPRSATSRSPSTKRLLVSAIAQVEPTGFRWVDSLETRGRRPRPAPVLAGTGRRRRSSGGERDKCGPSCSTTTGDRIGRCRSRHLPGGDGVSLQIDGKTAAFHWELMVE